MQLRETTVISASKAFPPPVDGDVAIQVAVADCYPFPKGASTDQRYLVEFIRSWQHPDYIRRQTDPQLADLFDSHLHLSFFRLAGKAFFVDYLAGVRDRLGVLADDGAE